jgi:hypothetical protein
MLSYFRRWALVSIGPVALILTTWTSLRAASVICASVQRPMRPKPLMPIVTVMKCAFPEILFVPSMGVRIQKHAAMRKEKVALFLHVSENIPGLR